MKQILTDVDNSVILTYDGKVDLDVPGGWNLEVDPAAVHAHVRRLDGVQGQFGGVHVCPEVRPGP